jgi:uncharacterized protein YqjF (DUF2071 family)
LRFLETNVRTYVRVANRDPGVYFFSLDAASLSAVVGARVGLGLPYFWATGRERITGVQIDYAIRRRGGRRPTCQVRYRVGGLIGPAAAGTLDHFLVERYVLHVQRGSSLWTVRVKHRPYPLHEVEVDSIDDRLVCADGIQAVGEPALVHFASGVDVAIYPPRIRLAC